MGANVRRWRRAPRVLAFGLALLAAAAWWPRGSRAQPVFLDDGAISEPRFALGDVDGDGVPEVIVGGRVGPFRAVTDPQIRKRARVEAGRMAGRMLHVMGASPELHVVEDVAAGDVDGDGRDEVMAVGGGRLITLGWEDGSLRIRHVEALPSGWTDRVAVGDADGDGSPEVALTLYHIEDGAEVGRTTLVLYRWQAGAWLERWSEEVPMHVGDLDLADLDGTGGCELVLEAGAGDEGGEGRLFRFTDGSYTQIWSGTITDYGRRALSLSAIPGKNGMVAVAEVEGSVRLFRMEGDALRFRGPGPVARGVTGLLLLQGSGQELTVLTGTGSAGGIRTHLLPY